MWRDLLLKAAQLIANLLGAIVLAALLATLSLHPHGFAPFLSAFLAKLAAAVRGDFGISATGSPAMAEALKTLPVTMRLIGFGAAIALLVGIPLGVGFGASRILRATSPIIELIAALPVFVASLVVIWLSHRLSHWSEATNSVQMLALQAAIVGVAGAGVVQLALRRGAEKAWSAPYHEGLRIMGLGPLDIGVRFATPEMIASLLRNLGQMVSALLSAAVVVEWIFARDGAGVLFLNCAMHSDWNLSAAILLLFAVLVLVTNFVGDIAAYFILPEDTDG